MQQFVPDLRDSQVSTALKKLTLFSLAIILIPLVSMFLLKKYFFEKALGYSHSDSLLYAAIAAIVLVHVILGFFIYVAWSEDEKPKRRHPDAIPEKLD